METLYCDGGVLGKNPSEHGGVWAWRLVNDQPGNNIVHERSGLLVPPTSDKLAMVAILWAIQVSPTRADITWRKFAGSEGVAFRCSNNHTEMWAVLDALSHMPDGWSGRLVTDSAVTIKRLQPDTLLNPRDVPIEFIQLIARTHQRLGPVQFDHVKGHPSRADLKAGHRNGRPVSIHQVWCDLECTRLQKIAMARINSLQAASKMIDRLVTR